jgi:hypothetical protein
LIVQIVRLETKSFHLFDRTDRTNGVSEIMMKPLGNEIKGIYFNTATNNVEVFIPEMLKSMNLPDTDANRDHAAKIAQEVFRELYPKAKQQVTDARNN